MQTNIRRISKKNNPSMHIKKLSRHKALQYIKPYLPEKPIILEAGAYKGNDSMYMARVWPQATLHLFEPVPEIFTQLTQTCAQLDNAHLWPVALSDHNGTLTLYVAEKAETPGVPTQASSALQPTKRTQHSTIVYPKKITIPGTTIDTWAEQHNISRIDFMWLDLQGYELHVLKQATQMLKTCTALLVELHFIQAYKDQPTADEIIAWLTAHGFVMIARDYDEPPQWFFGNGFFVKKNV